MSQQSSLTQSAHSVRQVLTAYNLWVKDIRGPRDRGGNLLEQADPLATERELEAGEARHVATGPC